MVGPSLAFQLVIRPSALVTAVTGVEGPKGLMSVKDTGI